MGHIKTVDIDYKTTNHASNINANNLNINAGYNESGNLSTNGTQNNIYIKGSDLNILGTTNFRAYGDVGILSAQDYSKHIFYSEAVEKDLGAIIGGAFMAAAGALAGAVLVAATGGAALGPMTALAVGTITDSNNNEIKIDNTAKFSVLSDFNIAKETFKKEEHKVELGSFFAMQFGIGLVSEFAGGMAGSYAAKIANGKYILMGLSMASIAAKIPIKSALESLSLSAMEVSGINEKHSDRESITEHKTEVKSNFYYNNFNLK